MHWIGLNWIGTASHFAAGSCDSFQIQGPRIRYNFCSPMELLAAPQNSNTPQLLLLVSYSPPRSESASQAMAWHGPSRIASLLPSEQALRQVKSRQVSKLSSSRALKRCRPLSCASYYFQLPAPWPLAHSFTLLSPLTKAPRMKTSERQRVIVAGMHFVSGFHMHDQSTSWLLSPVVRQLGACPVSAKRCLGGCG